MWSEKTCKSLGPNSFRIGMQGKLYALPARQREEFQNSVINVTNSEE